MKTKFFALAALAVMAVFSCQKTNPSDPGNPGGGGGDTPTPSVSKGLLNFSVSVPGTGISYTAKKAGPYQPGEVVVIEIPSSKTNPVSVTNLECFATLDNNCQANPAVPAFLDFTYPYQITVVKSDGSSQTNTIKVQLVYPAIQISQVWQKKASSFGQKIYNDLNLAIDDNYVYVLDAAGTATDCIHVLSRGDGSYVKDIALPATFIGQVFVDDAGVLCCSRYNIYGAGFRFFTYNAATSSWSEPIIDYASYEGHEIPNIPNQLGTRASLVGNVKTGTAYVIATAPDSKAYYTWKLTNGVPQATPTITQYGSVTKNWSFAVVRKASAEVGADTYIAGINYVAYPNESQSDTYVHKVKSTGDVVMMNPSKDNIGWRVLNFKTFKLGGYEMMAMACQYGEHRYDGCQFKVFNITDESKWNLKPGDAGYNIDFCNYFTDVYGTTNYNMSSGIDVRMSGSDVAYIFLGSPSRAAGDAPSAEDLDNCTVTCFKAIYSQN